MSARRHLVYAAHQSFEQGNFESVSMMNSFLAQEAFQKAFRTHRVWKETMRDKDTGLIPRTPGEKYWNGKDTGADCFPFLWLASHYLDPDSEPVWLAALNKERELSGALPRIIEFSPTRVNDGNMTSQIFDGAEYVKDGLISIADRRGRGPWFDRMEEVMQAILKNASFETKFGKICANDSEVNGDLLQILPRLYWATKKEEYLTMAERIFEVYVFEIFPQNNGLPAAYWNFATGKPDKAVFKFRDHGNEVIPGLAEVYFLEKMLGRPQAAKYREPLKTFLDLILSVGRSEDGMWYNLVDTNTHKVVQKQVVDNWGYILNAHRTFDLAEGTNHYGAEIERTMRAAASRKSFEWEHKDQDGYADSIESMLYQLAWNDLPECRLWVDDEAEVFFLKQLDSGFVEKNYLDGNFIRTALLYAQFKTQGAVISPWREDIRLGAAQDKKSGSLYLTIGSTLPWEGVLQVDHPRHQAFWNLPINYPRLNAWPEWFVAEPGKQYSVKDLDSGKITMVSGADLVKGFAVKMDGKQEVHLLISADSKSIKPAEPKAVSGS